MSAAVASSLGIVAYLALFMGVGLLFIFANLLLGRFLRPADPHAEKLEIYECGEPTIGSSFVQFDLRFYVVALLFIIFDVEVAFFFPWAAVFGKSHNMADPKFAVVESAGVLTDDATALYRELGVREPAAPNQIPPTLSGHVKSTDRIQRDEEIIRAGARQFVWVSIVDIGVFFAVLLVGFAYVWRRGDLDWVRAISREHTEQSGRAPPTDVAAEEPVLSV